MSKHGTNGQNENIVSGINSSVNRNESVDNEISDYLQSLLLPPIEEKIETLEKEILAENEKINTSIDELPNKASISASIDDSHKIQKLLDNHDQILSKIGEIEETQNEQKEFDEDQLVPFLKEMGENLAEFQESTKNDSEKIMANGEQLLSAFNELEGNVSENHEAVKIDSEKKLEKIEELFRQTSDDEKKHFDAIFENLKSESFSALAMELKSETEKMQTEIQKITEETDKLNSKILNMHEAISKKLIEQSENVKEIKSKLERNFILLTFIFMIFCMMGKL